jgi:RimJ/RimL family protein N-acetyltransferase
VIGFRRMSESDLVLMARWLEADHVIPWWGLPTTFEEVSAKYLRYIRGEKPVDPYVILFDGRAVGYIQTFRVAHWPAYWPPGKPYTAEPEAAGTDLLIGEKSLTGRGLGSEAIRRFVHEVVFAAPEVPACYADPAADNVASLAAFKNAGFVDMGPIEAPDDSTPRRLLRLARMPSVTR